MNSHSSGTQSTNRDQQVRAVKALLHDLKLQGFYKSPPIPIEDAAKTVGIRKIVEADISQSGRLIPVGQGYVVELNPREPRTRQRFTIAHEIGHVLVASAELRSSSSAHRFLNCRRDSGLERLCDTIAGHLLMPEVDLLAEVNKTPLTVSHVERIAKEFDVSLSALAIRIAEVTSRYAFVFWHWSSHASSARKAYRVKWSSSPRGVFIPRFDACADSCIVEECNSSGSRLSGTATLSLGNLRGTYNVHVAPRSDSVMMLVDIRSKC